jgi:hypothetical protein
MKTWKDITLRKAIKLEKLPEMDKLELIINQYAILNDISVSDVEDMTPAELLENSKEYEFLLKLPDSKRTDVVKINGRKYGLIDFSKMTLAQMVDIEEYYNSGLVDNAHKILSVIMLPIRFKFPFMKPQLVDYIPDPVREEDFLDLDMELVWGNLLFFYHIEMKYIKGLLDYLQENLKTRVDGVKVKVE